MEKETFGFSVRGASHIRSQKECQDRCCYYHVADNFDIIAVSDGHGSDACPYSAKGAEFAVAVFCERMLEYYKHYKNDLNGLCKFLSEDGDLRVAKEIDKRWKAKVLDWNRKHRTQKPVDINGKEDVVTIYRMYGCTLLGLVVTEEFVYAFQLGDGDIMFVSEGKAVPIINADKMLGVETHSLSSKDSWKKALSTVAGIPSEDSKPYLYMLSSDGLANSYSTDEDFEKTCVDYWNMIKENGVDVVKNNMEKWLSETSKDGCGDDISVVITYCD